MKPKNKFLWLLVGLFCFTALAEAQVPDGFNYQAVIRAAEGNILATENIVLQIDIINESDANTVVFSETHSLTTSAYGLVNLVIGEGINISGNLVDIPWGNGSYLLNVSYSLDGGTTFSDLGQSKLVAVPYAMFSQAAENVVWEENSGNIYYNEGYVGVGTNEPSGKFEVKGDATTSDNDLLFSVVNNTGDTVFAVYQGGVRIYVDDNLVKATGNKAGFAVGGFSSNKGITNEYLRISPDSVRIYVSSDEEVKGNKGGFAVGGFSSNKEDPVEFMHITPDNYFIGHRAGFNNTTGLYNTFFGYESGYGNTEGEENIFIGHESGYSNTLGLENVFIGNGAGFSNSTGYNNVYIGNWSGYESDTAVYNVFIGNGTGSANTNGSSNVIIGDAAGESNTLGSGNVFIGDWTGASNTVGENNVFLGEEAGWSNTIGNYNVFLGTSAGYSNIDGDGNVFLGDDAGYNNTSGFDNVFLGGSSGYENLDGEGNVFLGSESGLNNTSGSWNVFLGGESGGSNTLGSDNVFLGIASGFSNEEGNGNLYMGSESGYSNVDGSDNIFIGTSAGYFETGSGKLYISNWDSDSTESLVFGNFEDEILQVNYYLGVGRYPDANELEVEGDASKTVAGSWLANSDKRIKTNIQEIENAKDIILSLHPVKFKYSENWKAKYPSIQDKFYYNFLAQEFQEVFPESVKGSGEFLEGDDEEILQMDSYNAQIVTIKAVQEIIQENRELKSELEILKNEINDIKALLSQ